MGLSQTTIFICNQLQQKYLNFIQIELYLNLF